MFPGDPLDSNPRTRVIRLDTAIAVHRSSMQRVSLVLAELFDWQPVLPQKAGAGWQWFANELQSAIDGLERGDELPELPLAERLELTRRVMRRPQLQLVQQEEKFLARALRQSPDTRARPGLQKSRRRLPNLE